MNNNGWKYDDRRNKKLVCKTTIARSLGRKIFATNNY
jgi:hypothetical protein